MEKILKLTGLIAAFLICSYSYGQQIVSAEYFLDTDPGLGNGTAITITSPGDSVDVITSINMTGVSPGFHSLFIRTQNANGNWSLYTGERFYVNTAAPSPAPAGISNAEYFFDADPGVGNGTAVSTGALADSIDVTSAINTTGLSLGFHSLFVRVQNESGAWSLYEGRRFNIEAPFADTSYQVVSAEYFFDSDPGIGNGTAIATGSPGDSVDVNSSINTTGLTEGFHALFVRVLNQNGIWSLYEGRKFYINPPTSAPVPSRITNAEYFFDSDPGVGNGTAVVTGAPADSVDVTSGINATGLPAGFHGLFVRVQNESGIWSLYEGRRFYIDPPPAPAQAQIVQAESFFDHDPGVGNGTAVTPSFAQADSVDLFRSIGTGGLVGGTHYLCVRVLNQLGNWSLVMGDTLYVCGPTPGFKDSISGFSVYFTDSSKNASAHTWYFGDGDSSNVLNPNHTYTNTGTYHVTLVTTDSCGTDSTTNTVVITLTGINNEATFNGAKVYPNPNSGSFILAYHLTAANAELQVMDVTGRMIYTKAISGSQGLQQINIPDLSNGIFYWQIVSESKLTANGKIVVVK